MHQFNIIFRDFFILPAAKFYAKSSVEGNDFIYENDVVFERHSPAKYIFIKVISTFYYDYVYKKGLFSADSQKIMKKIYTKELLHTIKDKSNLDKSNFSL